MRRSRKFLAFLLAAVMLLSLAACGESGGTTASGEPSGVTTDGNTETVSTEPSEEPTEEPGDISWSFENGVLTISGKGAMQNYDDVSPEWEEHRSEIVSVVVEKGVTHIGDSAFGGYENLISADIASSVKSIGEFAFDETALVKVTGGDGVESVDGNAFNDVPWLKTEEFVILGDVLLKYNGTDAFVTIPSDVKAISGAFEDCDFINTVEIPKGVTEIGYSAFSGCTSLVMADIPDSVKTIGNYAFSGCASLVSVEIPKGVTEVGDGAFSYCSSLVQMDIPDSVETIGDYAFKDCVSLTSVEIPKNITEIGNETFMECFKLVSVKIGDGVETIGELAFYDCRNLTEIEIPESVTNINLTAFYLCNSLAEINVDENNQTFCSSEGILFSKDMSELIMCPEAFGGSSYVIPSGVNTIGEEAFEYCLSLTEVTIPGSVTRIEDDAFVGCSSLTRVVIPEGVTQLGWSVFWDTAITEVEIPKSLKSWGLHPLGARITDVYFTGSETEWTEGGYSDEDMGFFYRGYRDSVALPTIHYNSSMPE